ncbi:hypothetical protein BC829DRAFT_447800 [Chytridium lagenaria]|nr:hypothetical protein BC829DRAFT_447800 [Chytridium lagenaria]
MLTPAFKPAPFIVDPNLAAESHSVNPFRPIEGLGYLLRFAGIQNKEWTGSVLILQAIGKPIQKLTIFDNGKETTSEGTKLDSHGRFDFIRYMIKVPLTGANRTIGYQVEGRGKEEFIVPPSDRDARMLFTHAMVFGHDAKTLEEPFHIQIGGGDQLYADGNPHNIFEDVPQIAEWLQTRDIHDRFKVQWTYEGEKALSDFYLLAYAFHFQEPEFAKALATIPYTFICDDHDILDGYGSYPDYIRESPVLQNAGRHTSLADAANDPAQAVFPAPAGFSWVKLAGPSTLLVGIDNRSTRTENRVISDECWHVIWARLESTLERAKAVPVVYPRMKLAETVINTVSTIQTQVRSVFRTVEKSVVSLSAGFAKLFSQSPVLQGVAESSVGKHVVGSFGQPELKDDLLDEWTHPNHIEERNTMVRKLQDLATRFRVRVSFLSGDVHICGFGRFISSDSDDVNFINDPRGMVQVVSSAIGNNPPPGGILTYLHSNKRVLNSEECGIPDTNEEMLEVFKTDVDGNELENQRLMNRRNWASLIIGDDLNLTITLNVENIDREKDAVRYPVSVPLLK